MLTSIRGLSAATLSAGMLFAAAPAFAEQADADVTTVQDEQSVVVAKANQPIDADTANSTGGESEISISANVALTSEYRFRGVDLSGGEIAIQGGFDVALPGGFYVGTWASSLDEQTVGFGSTELDLYGGWSGDVTEGLSADIGAIAYMYPDAGAGEFDYYEVYGSLSFDLGPASLTPGVAYAFDQASLGDTDNLYLYTDASVGLEGTPITLNAHLGYTDGFLTFTNDSKAFDWSLGADLALDPVTLSVAYVGAEGDIPTGAYDFVDDALVLTVSASF